MDLGILGPMLKMLAYGVGIAMVFFVVILLLWLVSGLVLAMMVSAASFLTGKRFEFRWLIKWVEPTTGPQYLYEFCMTFGPGLWALVVSFTVLFILAAIY